MTDERHLGRDPQIQDDLVNWGIPPVEPSPYEYFPNDTLISDTDVPPRPREEAA